MQSYFSNYQLLMWFCPVNLMSLRQGLLWLTPKSGPDYFYHDFSSILKPRNISSGTRG
jgi:hypothetical protein